MHAKLFNVNLTLQLPIEWPVTINEIVLTGFLNIKEVPRILDDPNDPKVYKTVFFL